jgi:photosystem II stability/assembly factor-like uncharacterized protein
VPFQRPPCPNICASIQAFSSIVREKHLPRDQLQERLMSYYALRSRIRVQILHCCAAALAVSLMLSGGAHGAFVVAVGNGGAIRHSLDSGANWFTRTSGVTVDLHGVDSVGSDSWIVGAGGTILHSGNAGVTWTPQTSGSAEDLFDVDFVDAQVGWAVGAGGAVLRTVNGGATWTPQTMGTNQAHTTIAALSGSVAWTGSSIGLIRHTTNGGQTWGFQTAAGGPHAIAAVSPSVAYYAGVNNIGHTSDSGTQWNDKPVEQVGHDIQFLTPQHGWTAGDDGKVLISNDGGGQWRPSTGVGTTNDLNAIAMLDRFTGWIVGAEGVVRRTRDGGDSWTPQNGRFTGVFNDVAAVNVPTLADFDLDGRVNGNDFLVWQRSLADAGRAMLSGDVTGDGAADGEDLAVFSQQFGVGPVADGAAASVPEPSGPALVAIVAVARGLVRRAPQDRGRAIVA